MRASNSKSSPLVTAGRMSRTVAIALIAGVRRRLSMDDVEDRILALPLRDQALVTVATLSALFLVSLLAAQFGLIGLAVFWLGVILIIR